MKRPVSALRLWSRAEHRPKQKLVMSPANSDGWAIFSGEARIEPMREEIVETKVGRHVVEEGTRP